MECRGIIIFLVLVVGGCLNDPIGDRCLEEAQGDKAVFDECVCRELAEEYPNETDRVYEAKCGQREDSGSPNTYLKKENGKL